MTRDFYWSRDSLSTLRVGLHSSTKGKLHKEVKLQLFEVVVAAVFARLRPDYDWWVTPNLPDDGVDFVGRGAFLKSTELGINAAITIGGQCKKRERVDDVVGELAGSLVRMAQAIHPTFFVAALSATLGASRVAAATTMLETTLQRHCHILDRRQLEGLIAANLPAAMEAIQKALPGAEGEFLLGYFRKRSEPPIKLTIQVASPPAVLAGEPFRVRLQVSKSSLSASHFRLCWHPSHSQAAGILLSPLTAMSPEGFKIDFGAANRESPFIEQMDLEFLLYAIGPQPLGTVLVLPGTGSEAPLATAELPPVQVVENLRPPFYAAPYREPHAEMERAYRRAQAGKVSCVAVVGAGGAGKTRLCEEMSRESRRHGAHVVSARQAHSVEFPRRILANLLLDLVEIADEEPSASRRVEQVVARLAPELAARAGPAIEALCGQAGKPGSLDDDQALLSVLAVLIAQQCRSRTIIIHLHDLHWCTLDVLETLDRLIWQLDHLQLPLVPGGPPAGLRVLFLLEGRLHEHRQDAETGWSTRMFERFIDRLGCPVARCRPFEPQESAAFTQRLFEQAHSARPQLPRALLSLQQELIDTVHRVAGGNPLHLLEQVKLLQQHGILSQNPMTGLIYMVRPDFHGVKLPPTVLETIEARWRYCWINDQRLAILLWAAALVDDNLPAPLFRHLWSELAPQVTQTRIEATEFIRFPASAEHGLQVSFRHENYFQTMRRIQLPAAERQLAVDAYSKWFEGERKFNPALRYVQARVALEAPKPDRAKVRRLLRSALRAAENLQDRSLQSRILGTLLDSATWPAARHRALSVRSLARACEDELKLCTLLERSGRTDVAFERIELGLTRVESRLYAEKQPLLVDLDELRAKRFRLLAMKAEILCHDRRPAEAVAITDKAVTELRNFPNNRQWRDIFMEMQHTHSAALAFAGDLKQAVREARNAASIAEKLVETSSDALGVLITYANILLCEIPAESEAVLVRCLRVAESVQNDEGIRLRLAVNLAMTRMVLSYQQRDISDNGRLASAHESLLLVFRKAHPLGRLKDAAAAALLLGVIHALWQSGDDIDWFTQATTLAARARQLETLWRAHINLAHSLFRAGQSPHDAAAAAFELMTYSLDAFAEPDRTPRFDLLAVPLAHSVRYLLLAKDARGSRSLGQYPALRRMFHDLERGELREDRDGRTSHEWFRVESADYVIY